MKPLFTLALFVLVGFGLKAQDTTAYSPGKALPNVITPNNDGYNDVFAIPGLSPGDDVQIFNRYGTLLYKFFGPGDHWDGRNTSGALQRPGVYFFTIRTTTGSSNGVLHLLQ